MSTKTQKTKFDFSVNAEEVVVFPAKFAEIIVSLLKGNLLSIEPRNIIEKFKRELENTKLAPNPIKASIVVSKEYIEYHEFVNHLITGKFDIVNTPNHENPSH